MWSSDSQSYERLRHHYEIEKKLADRLRTSSKAERKYLYPIVYDELFRLVPDHPQLSRKKDPCSQRATAKAQLALVRLFLRKDSTFLELGAGDCAFSAEIAKHVEQVFALDVSRTVTNQAGIPRNMSLIISQGTSIPLPASSIDITYSNDLMEHLHPDDAYEQLQDIYRVLKPAGVYICHTPNRLVGPSDVSRYFDDVATGLHLREYTVRELDHWLKTTGFALAFLFIGGRGKYLRFPLWIMKVLEHFLEKLPRPIKKTLMRTLILRALLGINIVAEKRKSGFR